CFPRTRHKLPSIRASQASRRHVSSWRPDASFATCRGSRPISDRLPSGFGSTSRPRRAPKLRALSRTAWPGPLTVSTLFDQGYGVVCDLGCNPIRDLSVIDANQEHGIIAHRSGVGSLPDLPIGATVRILPNHACATAAQHDRYHVTND